MNKILTFGVFDYFHLGHLRLFKQCRHYADYLIVAVQEDSFIKRFKPNAEVMYTTAERVEIIESLRIVNKVVVYDVIGPKFLETVDFDILALGEDHRGGRFDEAQQWCVNHGKQVIRLKRTEGICSSDIKRNVLK